MEVKSSGGWGWSCIAIVELEVFFQRCGCAGVATALGCCFGGVGQAWWFRTPPELSWDSPSTAGLPGLRLRPLDSLNRRTSRAECEFRVKHINLARCFCDYPQQIVVSLDVFSLKLLFYEALLKVTLTTCDK